MKLPDSVLTLLADAEAFVSSRACTPQGRRLAARLARQVKTDLLLLPDEGLPPPACIPEGWVKLKAGQVIKKGDLIDYGASNGVLWVKLLAGFRHEGTGCPVFRHPSLAKKGGEE